MKSPEEQAAELLVDNGHYNDFLLGKPISEDKLSADIANAIRQSYLEGRKEAQEFAKIVSRYLSYSSLDGKPERMTIRKEIAQKVEELIKNVDVD